MEADRPRRLKALRFRWSARFGFFLRAEASNAGFGYPVAPRTAMLGLIANVIGLEKDTLAEELAEAQVAVSGSLPATHWHCGNYRKVPPAPVPYRVQVTGGRRETSPEKNTRLRQEWLIAPSFQVIASLPDPHHVDLRSRLERGTSYFTPCMGLSEMLAEVEYGGEEELEALDPGAYPLIGLVRAEQATKIEIKTIFEQKLHVVSLSLPRSVTATRRFDHAHYLVERDGKPLPCTTDRGWQSSLGPICFL